MNRRKQNKHYLNEMMPKRAGDDHGLDAPRQIVEGAESRAIHGVCPPEVLRPRQLPQLRSLSQCLVSGMRAPESVNMSVLFFVILLHHQKTDDPSLCFAHLFMHASASIGGAILAHRHRLHIIYNPYEKYTERTQGIPPHLLGSRHRFVLPRGAATISNVKIKKEDDDERTMDHSILPLLTLTRHSSHLFFTSSFVSRSYSSGAYRSSALE